MKEIILQEGEEIKEYYHNQTQTKWFVTNYGRFFSKTGKCIKPILRCQKYSKNYMIQPSKIINGKRIRGTISCARIVYKLFVNPKLKDNSFITYKDGNRANCRFDNLSVGLEHRPHREGLPPDKQALFDNPKTLIYIRQKLWFWYDGDFRNIKHAMLFEDLIQESLFMVYQALFDYKHTSEKKYKNYVRHIVEMFVCKRYHREKVNYIYNDNLLYY